MKNFKRKISLELAVLLTLIFFGIYSGLLIYTTTANHKYQPDNHLVLLAKRFAEMKLSLSPFNIPKGDIVDYHANFYLFFGPFSSLILMPFVLLFGQNFPQVLLGAGSLLLAFLAVFKIAHAFKYSEKDSLWLSIFFVFSTVLFGVGTVNISAYQVQALGTSLVLLSLAEYFGKKRFWLVGLIVALAGLTRATLYLSLIFYLLEWHRLKLNKKVILSLLIPIVISGLVLAGYNYKRFRSFTETGYKHNVTLNSHPMQGNVQYGFISLKHIPANLYVLLLKVPDPVLEPGGGFVFKFPFLKADPWGMAIWFNSPLLFMLLKLKKNKFSKSSFITTMALLLPTITYFGIGYFQFGYRYALDFLPFLFLLLLPNLGKKLSFMSKSLIIIGVIFNCVYLASLWDLYPHFFYETRFGHLIGGLKWSRFFY